MSGSSLPARCAVSAAGIYSRVKLVGPQLALAVSVSLLAVSHFWYSSLLSEGTQAVSPAVARNIHISLFILVVGIRVIRLGYGGRFKTQVSFLAL